MKTGVVAIAVVLIAAIIGGFYWYNSSGQSIDVTQEQMNQMPQNSGVENTSGTSTSSETTNPDVAETHTININNFAFETKILTIKVGDTVTWTNLDSVGHTVTSDSGSELSSGTISKNGVYSHTFTTTGEFGYHCTPHPYMTGKVVVQ